MLNKYDFVKKLLIKVPSLQFIYDEHIKNNDELLAHVFTSDISRYVQENLNKRQRTDEIDCIFAVMKDAFHNGDDNVENIVSVSFLEQLCDYDHLHSEIMARLSDDMKKTFLGFC